MLGALHKGYWSGQYLENKPENPFQTMKSQKLLKLQKSTKMTESTKSTEKFPLIN